MTETKRWFRLKRYGWGWVPISWQGFALIAGYMLLIVCGGLLLLDSLAPSVWDLGLFFAWTFFWTVPLFYVSYKKGGIPRWRWGGKDNE